MQLFKNLGRAWVSVIIVSILALSSSAQDGRPRYAGSSYDQSTLPPDTVISVQLNGKLSSGTARVGDKFTATVTVPVYISGRTVIPAGAVVEGRVTQVTPAKRMNRSGTISVDFDDIVFPNGAVVPLVGALTSDDPETRKRIDDESRVSGPGNKHPTVFIGGGGALGAVLGGIAGGGKGAVLGGVVGAGAGVAGVLLSKGEEAEVPSGTTFGVQLKQALVIRDEALAEAPPDATDRSAGRRDRPDPSSQPDRVDDRDPRPELRDRSASSRADRDDRPLPSRTDSEDRPEPDRPEADNTLPLSSPEMLRRAQTALKEQGYFEGEADGVMNARTAGALRTYQREHNLQPTGDLDPQTAKSLGLYDSASSGRRSAERRPDPRSDSLEVKNTGLANILSATATKTTDGAIFVAITTQANTGGWRWFEEHVVNGDTLEVYARAQAPTGMVTQVLTKGRIEATVRDDVQYVRRVVIHGAGGDQVIALDGRSTPAGRRDAGRDVGTADNRSDTSRDAGSGGYRNDTSRDTGVRSSRTDSVRDSGPSASPSPIAIGIQRKAEDLLSEYQRVYGVRMTGSSVQVDNINQYRESEIELLFAIDSFANAAQLYNRLSGSLRDRQSLRAATLAMARQARRTDRVIATTNSRGADSLAARWDSIREDVLRMMQTYSIDSSEIEN